MARPNLARRFEPSGGVSESMIELEAEYVGRELEDFLLYSTSDLRQRLADLAAKLTVVEKELQTSLRPIPDRERLAIKFLLARDQWHLAMLYRKFIAMPQIAQATGSSDPVAEEVSEATDEIKPVVGFGQLLAEE